MFDYKSTLVSMVGVDNQACSPPSASSLLVYKNDGWIEPKLEEQSGRVGRVPNTSFMPINPTHHSRAPFQPLKLLLTHNLADLRRT